MELTGYQFHKHYCENDSESIIRLFGDRFSWLGAGENEYAAGTGKVIEIFLEKQRLQYPGTVRGGRQRHVCR